MSTSALPVHVALVDDTHRVGASTLAQVAGALSEQVAADFAPVWHVRASVGVYPAQAVPPGMWAVRIVEDLQDVGALGFHTTENGQPVSFVERGEDWPSVASHELLEMLADPWGMRMHQARLPAGLEDRYGDFGLPRPVSRVSYLLEVSDPCEATSYAVGGQRLSDFLHPAWYRSDVQPGARYSHAGGCVKPREVARGGYVSFCHGPEWFQVFNHLRGLEVRALGRFSDNNHASLRVWMDEAARAHRERDR
jgi:hypothetical protein